MRFKTIVRHNLTEPILQLRRAGKSLRDIETEIREKYGTNLGINQIQSFLNSRPEILAKRIAMDDELEKKHVEAIIDANQQFITLNNRMQVFFDKLEKRYDQGKESSASVIKAADHLMTQLRYVAELMGKVNQKKVLHLSFHDQATNVQKILDKLYKDKKLYCKRCKSRDIAFDLGGMDETGIIVDIPRETNGGNT